MTSSVIPALGNVCTSCNAAYWQEKSVHTSRYSVRPGLTCASKAQLRPLPICVVPTSVICLCNCSQHYISQSMKHLAAAVSDSLINIAPMHSTDSSKITGQSSQLAVKLWQHNSCTAHWFTTSHSKTVGTCVQIT